MASKESNPGTTGKILNIIAIGFLLIIDIALCIMAFQYWRGKELDPNSCFTVCGICLSLPMFAIFLIVCASNSLGKRGIYGDKHSTSTVIAFVLHMVGALFLMGGNALIFLVLQPEDGIAFVVSIPFVLIVWGWFLEVKDVGGKIPALVGAIVYTIGKGLFMFGLIKYFSTQEEDLSQLAADQLTLPAVGSVICILGLIGIGAGFIMSIVWMGKNKPLIDTEQKKIMETQTKQLELQGAQIEFQKKQLLATRQLQAQLLEGGALSPQIGHEPGADDGRRRRNGMKCPRCGEYVERDWKTCPKCSRPLRTEKKCPGCGGKVEKGWKTCPRCSRPLGKDRKKGSKRRGSERGGSGRKEGKRRHGKDSHDKDRIQGKDDASKCPRCGGFIAEDWESCIRCNAPLSGGRKTRGRRDN